MSNVRGKKGEAKCGISGKYVFMVLDGLEATLAEDGLIDLEAFVEMID